MAKAAHPITAYLGTGRRKTAIAQVRLVPGTGKVRINERELEEYIPVPTWRAHAVFPLEATESARKFDAEIRVEGGGPNGQAGAIRLGLARALLQAAPELKPTLRQKGLLTRDPRARERKKYGQPGARRRFQFSKR